LANEANNVKFGFLNPTDPYHAYYRLRVRAALPRWPGGLTRQASATLVGWQRSSAALPPAERLAC
jgi:splicing factor 3A subunit 1